MLVLKRHLHLGSCSSMIPSKHSFTKQSAQFRRQYIDNILCMSSLEGMNSSGGNSNITVCGGGAGAGAIGCGGDDNGVEMVVVTVVLMVVLMVELVIVVVTVLW